MPSYSNTFSQQFEVSLTNMATDMVRSMNSLAVEVLVSRGQWLALVQSHSAGCTVSHGETTSLAMQMVQLETVEPQWQDIARLNQLQVNVNISGGRLH